MQLKIKNHIKVDGQTEMIEELFSCEYREISEKIWLSYQNTDSENVLIKFDKKELTMTRFGDFPTTMRYRLGEKTENPYQGLGVLEIQTSDFVVSEGCVKIAYTLTQEGVKLGSYRLEINYGNE